MEADDVSGVLATLRSQLNDLRNQVLHEEAVRVNAFEQDKPQLKQLIAALEESRQVLDGELKAMQANPQQAKAKQVAKKGVQAISTGFNAIRSRPRADGKPMTDDELRAERQHLQDSIDVLGNKISSVREDIAKNMRAEEKEIWETNLVILQVTTLFCFATATQLLHGWACNCHRVCACGSRSTCCLDLRCSCPLCLRSSTLLCADVA